MSAHFAGLGTSWGCGAFALCGLIALGCAGTQPGATAADLARASDSTQLGSTVFANECAKCHGQRGEGVGNASAILGPGALPEYPRGTVGAGDPGLADPQLLQIEAQSRPAGAAWRDPFRNAQDLFAFISTHMPKGHGGELKQPDAWAVVSFMLAAQGASVPPGGLGPANATSTQIPRR